MDYKPDIDEYEETFPTDDTDIIKENVEKLGGFEDTISDMLPSLI